MKTLSLNCLAQTAALLAVFVIPSDASGQYKSNCAEISADVRAAVEKDRSKVLMVVEDALVINEGCASEIVRAAISASKADAVLANQIVQTAISTTPKMAAVIEEAALETVPGYVASGVKPEVVREVTASGKNPGKNMVLDSPEPEEEITLDSPTPFAPSMRGVSVPGAPFGPITRTGQNPLSPSTVAP